MEIGIKTLIIKKCTLALFFTSCVGLLQCCSSGEKENKGAEPIPIPEHQSSHELKRPDNGILWTQVPPDKQRQTHYKSGRKIYEAEYNKDGKVSSRVIPRVEDAFLHEDKFYLKVILPFGLAGEIKAVTSLKKPLYLTKIDNLTYQVSLHEALDLERFNLTLHYLPAPEDSILAWEKTFEIPIVPQF
jgi:hypothetical protein